MVKECFILDFLGFGTFVSWHLEEEDLMKRRVDALEVDSVLTQLDPDPGLGHVGLLAHCSQSRGWKLYGGEQV